MAVNHCPEYGMWIRLIFGGLVGLIEVVQITLSGLCLVLLNFLTMLYYDPTYLTLKGGATGPPQWVYFTCVYVVSSQSRYIGGAGGRIMGQRTRMVQKLSTQGDHVAITPFPACCWALASLSTVLIFSDVLW